MKRLIAVFISFMTLLLLSCTALAADTSAKSIECLDREYTFLDGTEYSYVTSGVGHLAMLRPDGSLWMAGDNYKGQLGIGKERHAYNAPVKIMENVRRVKAKESSTTVIKNDGSVWRFGEGTYSPKKLADNAIDADSWTGKVAYIDTAGTVYLETYSNGEKQKIAESGKEVYLFFNETRGNGFVTPSTSPGIISFDNFREQVFNNTIADWFIVVRHNDDSVVQYNLSGNGSITSEKICDGAAAITVYEGLYSGYICVRLHSGNIIYAGRGGGLKTEAASDVVSALYTHHGLCLLKSNGELYNVKTGTTIANNVKMFTPLSDDAFFVIDNNNVASVHGSEKLETMFAFLKEGYVDHSPSVEMYDDIYAKTMEIVAGETDKYIQAKLVSTWISENIKYKTSGHDQSGVEAFRQGTAVCAGFARLTAIMLKYLDIPVSVNIDLGINHAWNYAMIDGMIVIIDNTGGGAQFDSSYSYPNTILPKYYYRMDCDPWALPELRAAQDFDLLSPGFVGSTDKRTPITRLSFCNIVRAVIEKSKGQDIDSLLFALGKADIPVGFTDTADGDVAAMYRLGIINGKSDTEFAPNDNISRQEAAKIMRNLAIVLGEDASAPAADYADMSNVASWAVPGVNFVSHNGIMKGRPDGFDPLNSISSQEAAIVCYRYFNSLN